MSDAPMVRMTLALEPLKVAAPITEVPLDIRVKRLDSTEYVALEAGEFAVLLNELEALALSSAIRRLAAQATSTHSARESVGRTGPAADEVARLTAFEGAVRAALDRKGAPAVIAGVRRALRELEEARKPW
jgi:hypothetical protein